MQEIFTTDNMIDESKTVNYFKDVVMVLKGNLRVSKNDQILPYIIAASYFIEVFNHQIEDLKSMKMTPSVSQINKKSRIKPKTPNQITREN